MTTPRNENGKFTELAAFRGEAKGIGVAAKSSENAGLIESLLQGILPRAGVERLV